MNYYKKFMDIKRLTKKSHSKKKYERIQTYTNVFKRIRTYSIVFNRIIYHNHNHNHNR